MPYADVKRTIKEAILLLCNTHAGDSLGEPKAENKALKQLLLHNLACINYVELQAFLERGDDDSQVKDQSLLEQLNRIEEEKKENEAHEAKLKEEVYI